MTLSRLERIVAQVSALRPDIVLIAGDFISDKRMATRHYSLAEAIAPLALLRPRLATIAVLGNHDYWRAAGEARRALHDAGAILLENSAVEVGPLAIGGLADPYTRHDDPAATIRQMRALPGARLLLAHSPDPFPDLPADIGLMLAGHTHCGQVRLPLIGAVSTMSRYGQRYACGLIREQGRTLIVTAGLGTSGLPLRLGAVPDLWLVTIGPRSAAARSRSR
jgi:predicted MPP superfamily phosphohydrolase